jgi:hypothetical protein
VVFRRYRPPLSVKKEGSSSRELGSPPEFVVPASARCCPGAFHGVPHLFATSAQRVHDRWASQAHLCSVRSVSRALDGLLLTEPCRLVSSCCHVQASRFRGFLPRPDRDHLVGGPCLRAVGAVSCRRLPDDAGERRVDLEACSRPGSAAPTEVLAPYVARVPSCACAPSGSLRQSWRRGERPLRSRSWLPGARSAPDNEPSACRSTDDLDALSLDHPPVRAS